MAWVQFENTALQRYHNDEYMPDEYWIDVNDNGSAQVTEDVAQALIESDLAVQIRE